MFFFFCFVCPAVGIAKKKRTGGGMCSLSRVCVCCSRLLIGSCSRCAWITKGGRETAPHGCVTRHLFFIFPSLLSVFFFFLRCTLNWQSRHAEPIFTPSQMSRQTSQIKRKKKKQKIHIYVKLNKEFERELKKKRIEMIKEVRNCGCTSGATATPIFFLVCICCGVQLARMASSSYYYQFPIQSWCTR